MTKCSLTAASHPSPRLTITFLLPISILVMFYSPLIEILCMLTDRRVNLTFTLFAKSLVHDSDYLMVSRSAFSLSLANGPYHFSLLSSWIKIHLQLLSVFYYTYRYMNALTNIHRSSHIVSYHYRQYRKRQLLSAVVLNRWLLFAVVLKRLSNKIHKYLLLIFE